MLVVIEVPRMSILHLLTIESDVRIYGNNSSILNLVIMKSFSFLIRFILSFSALLFLTSCYKIDWIGGGFPAEKNYQVEQCISTLYTPDHPFLFVKSYSGASLNPVSINASFFNEISPDQLFHYDLRIVYKGRFIFLINKNNVYDTLYFVEMNDKNRPIVSRGIGDLGDFRYEYKNNRLVSVNWGLGSVSNYKDTCIYDNYGNILSIKPSVIGDGYTYEYDYSRKAKYQYYQDELRMLNNGFTLLCYLGLFPELNPVNIRTHVNVGSAPSGGFWSKYLINHEIDDKGRLVKYGVTSSLAYPELYTMTIKWRPL